MSEHGRSNLSRRNPSVLSKRVKKEAKFRKTLNVIKQKDGTFSIDISKFRWQKPFLPKDYSVLSKMRAKDGRPYLHFDMDRKILILHPESIRFLSKGSTQLLQDFKINVIKG